MHAWTLCWFQINRVVNILNQGRLYKRSTNYHKIIIVGDGLAEGFGDNNSCGRTPGVAAPLQNKILACGPKFRHAWQVLNVGHSMSTSALWLPGAALVPGGDSYFGAWLNKLRNTGSTNMWAAVRDDPRWCDAEVAVVMLGNNDDPSTPPEETVKNIMVLADNLVKKGMHTFVCPLPLPSVLTHPRYYVLRERNEALEKALTARAVRDEKDTERNEKEPIVRLGAPLGGLKYRRDALFSKDGWNLNHEGYKKAAVDVFENISNTLVAIEWQYFKARQA